MRKSDRGNRDRVRAAHRPSKAQTLQHKNKLFIYFGTDVIRESQRKREMKKKEKYTHRKS